MIRPFIAVAAIATAIASGCASSRPAIVPVQGVLILDDKPVPNAEVQFVPMERGLGAEYIAFGTTDEQGRFTLLCNGQPGALRTARTASSSRMHRRRSPLAVSPAHRRWR